MTASSDCALRRSVQSKKQTIHIYPNTSINGNILIHTKNNILMCSWILKNIFFYLVELRKSVGISGRSMEAEESAFCSASHSSTRHTVDPVARRRFQGQSVYGNSRSSRSSYIEFYHSLKLWMIWCILYEISMVYSTESFIFTTFITGRNYSVVIDDLIHSAFRAVDDVVLSLIHVKLFHPPNYLYWQSDKEQRTMTADLKAERGLQTPMITRSRPAV